MVKLKTSTKIAKASKKLKGKRKRSFNGESDNISDNENGGVINEDADNDTVLNFRKLKDTDTDTVSENSSEGVEDEHNNEEVQDEYNNEDGIDDESMSDEHENKVNNVSASANLGWADAMQKILKTKKPKKRKSIVLSKAKKLQDVKQKLEQDETTEVDTTGNKAAKKILNDVESNDKSSVQGKSRRKNLSLGIRTKPSFEDRERERMLQKIATKGVVQLFNAVRQQQTEISQKLLEAGPLERKREKVYKDINKNTFLDVLMGGAKSVPVENVERVKTEEKNEKEDKIWSVLRDDFVMGAKLKDWDKKSDSDNESSSAPEDMDSDD